MFGEVEPKTKFERRARPWRAPGGRFNVPWGALAAAAVFALFLLLIYTLQMSTLRGIPDSYEGVVIDKSLTIQESEQGSWPQRRLLVRVEDGRVLRVPAGPELYESARAGMRIRKSAAGVELTWTEFEPKEAAGGR
jgi:hypothetical protein